MARPGDRPQSSFRQNPAGPPKSSSLVDPKVPSPNPVDSRSFYIRFVKITLPETAGATLPPGPQVQCL